MVYYTCTCTCTCKYVHSCVTMDIAICYYYACCYYCAVVEEEYQACASRREEKEGTLNDARAELEALIADVEQHTQRLSQLDREEEEAKIITLSHPELVSGLRERMECVLGLFATHKTDTEERHIMPCSDEHTHDSATTDEHPTNTTSTIELSTHTAATDQHPHEEVESMDTSAH